MSVLMARLFLSDFNNYCVQVKVGGDEYVHVRVYQDLKQHLSLASYQKNKKIDDPIEYF